MHISEWTTQVYWEVYNVTYIENVKVKGYKK